MRARVCTYVRCLKVGFPICISFILESAKFIVYIQSVVLNFLPSIPHHNAKKKIMSNCRFGWLLFTNWRAGGGVNNHLLAWLQRDGFPRNFVLKTYENVSMNSKFSWNRAKILGGLRFTGAGNRNYHKSFVFHFKWCQAVGITEQVTNTTRNRNTVTLCAYCLSSLI